MKKLSPAQYRALSKWRDGKPENQKELKVRYDVYEGLLKMKHLTPSGFLLRVITESGLEALKDFEGKKS